MSDDRLPSKTEPDYNAEQVIKMLREGVMDRGEAEKYVLIALKKLQENGDTEVAHVRADDLLCAFLETIGYKEIADAFDYVDKWYA